MWFWILYKFVSGFILANKDFFVLFSMDISKSERKKKSENYITNTHTHINVLDDYYNDDDDDETINDQ